VTPDQIGEMVAELRYGIDHSQPLLFVPQSKIDGWLGALQEIEILVRAMRNSHEDSRETVEDRISATNECLLRPPNSSGSSRFPSSPG
jgi:hypothetical protein